MPLNATHESVKHQFNQFGNVAYVSLPKYRSSGRIKEFAFVEFEDKSSVEKCINAFRQFDGVIGDTQNAENLASVVSYVKEQEDLENAEEKQQNPDEDNEIDSNDERESKNDGKNNINDEKQDAIGSKRSKEDPAAIDSDGVSPSKRVKTDETDGLREGDGDGDAGGKTNQEHEQEQEKDDNDNSDDKASITDDKNRAHKKKK